MIVLIVVVIFIVAFTMGLITGASFVVNMYNSDKQKDRDWADRLLKNKKHGPVQ